LPRGVGQPLVLTRLPSVPLVLGVVVAVWGVVGVAVWVGTGNDVVIVSGGLKTPAG
jgi:hypothetical protein